MADFVAVLRKTIGGLGENTPELRQKVYDKARATISAKIAAIQPPPPALVIERQNQALEDAISVVEAEYAPPPAVSDDDDLDTLLANFGQEEPSIPAATPSTRMQPVTKAPAVSSTIKTHVDQPGDGADPEPERGDEPYDAAVDPVFSEAPPVPVRGNRDEELRPVAPLPRREPELPLTKSTARPQPARKARRAPTGLIAAALLLIVLAGASYGIWLNRAEFAAMLGLDEPAVEDVAAAPSGSGEPAATPPPAAPQTPASPAPATEQQAATTPAAPDASAAGGEQTSPDDVQKFTQRLTESGDEIDPGPAGGEPGIGEGTSVAAATQAPGSDEAPASAAQADEPAPTAAAQPQQGVPVGQRAIFYEERTTMADSTAEQGNIVWTLIQESPGGNLPPEPAIRAEVSIPSKELEMRLTIRRNEDTTLPASHIIEMIFLTPENFSGGAVDNVLRVAFKPSEESAGRPLFGIPAKIADGYFLVALSDQEADTQANLQLLERESWIDIPIIYSNGRRALVTMEKGIPGERVFNEAISAWRAAAGNAG